MLTQPSGLVNTSGTHKQTFTANNFQITHFIIQAYKSAEKQNKLNTP